MFQNNTYWKRYYEALKTFAAQSNMPNYGVYLNEDQYQQVLCELLWLEKNEAELPIVPAYCNKSKFNIRKYDN